MRTHAVFLLLEGRECVVVGGDGMAESKVYACLQAGATVTVVAPTLTAGLEALARERRIRHLDRAYRAGDLAGATLAYAAVADVPAVAALRDEAAREHVLLNVIDRPEACDFFAPAVVARGDLQVAIGTGGTSPGLASALRRDLEGRLGPEYGPFVAILGAVRRHLATDPRRIAVMDALLASPLLDVVRRGARDEADRLLGGLVGDGCTLAHLGISLEAEA
jgi:precorrin-2 dehydrogenase/sirohydrochlorin ferrochelatase